MSCHSLVSLISATAGKLHAYCPVADSNLELKEGGDGLVLLALFFIL